MEFFYYFLNPVEIDEFIRKYFDEKIFSIMSKKEVEISSLTQKKTMFSFIDDGLEIKTDLVLDEYIILFILSNIFYREEISTFKDIYEHIYYKETLHPYIYSQYRNLKTAIIDDALLLFFYRSLIEEFSIEDIMKTHTCDKNVIKDLIRSIRKAKIKVDIKKIREVLSLIGNNFGSRIKLLMPSICIAITWKLDKYPHMTKSNICKFLPSLGLVLPEEYSDADNFNKCIYRAHRNKYYNSSYEAIDVWRYSQTYPRYCTKEKIFQFEYYIHNLIYKYSKADKSQIDSRKNIPLEKLKLIYYLMRESAVAKSIGIFHFNSLTNLLDLAFISKGLPVEAYRIKGLSLKYELSLGIPKEDDPYFIPEVYYAEEKIRQAKEFLAVVEDIQTEVSECPMLENIEFPPKDAAFKKMYEWAQVFAELTLDDLRYRYTEIEKRGYTIIKKPLIIEKAQVDVFNSFIEEIVNSLESIEGIRELIENFINDQDPYFDILAEVRTHKVSEADVFNFSEEYFKNCTNPDIDDHLDTEVSCEAGSDVSK